MNQPLAPLTARELDILRLIGEGLSDQEIGTRLFVSTGTVKWHIKNIYSKLAVHKRTAAVAQARAFNLLNDIPEAPLKLPTEAHNIPHPASSFVGRETDLSNLLEMLTDRECRLVSIVGIGGIGKTRLALECASRLVGSYRDSAWFVGLETVAPHLLPSTIASTLQIQTMTQQDLRYGLLQILRHRHLLLILDSFEHLLEETPYLSQILATAPEVKLMVTSRMPLNLAGEWIHRLVGLAVPAAEEIDDSGTYGAAKLFVDRARQIRPGFSPALERKGIAAICQRVGGTPLAIEILAAWLRVLSCDEILNQLDAIQEPAANSYTDSPTRHHSLRGIFDQSWQLLDADEQVALLWMSIFRGGFTRAALAAIAQISLNTLLSLVDKSLVMKDDQNRLDLHPLIRQFAQERLRTHPDTHNKARRAHANYYAAMLVALATEARLDDIENIWEGLAFAVEARDMEGLAQYAKGIRQYFESRGWYLVEDHILDIYRASIALVQSRLDTSSSPSHIYIALLDLYECLVNSLLTARRYEEARAMAEAALTFTSESDAVIRSRLYRRIGASYAAQRIPIKLALAAYENANNALSAAIAVHNEQGWKTEWIELHIDKAFGHYLASDVTGILHELDLLEDEVLRSGSHMQRAGVYSLRAMVDLRVYVYRDLPERTLQNSIEALNCARQASDERQVAWLRFSLGFVYLWRDEMDIAEYHITESIRLSERAGDSSATYVTAHAYLPVVYRRRQAIDIVESLAAQGLKAAEESNSVMYASAAHGHLAWVNLRKGQYAEAGYWCRKASDALAQLPFPFPIRWMAECTMLELALLENQFEKSIEHARTLIDPKNQRLLSPLPQLLANAVAAAGIGQNDNGKEYLTQFCLAGRPFGYT